MTAHKLLEDIFRRPQGVRDPNLRVITRAQLTYLRDLIAADARASGAPELARGLYPGEHVWSPAGPWQYVLAEAQPGTRVYTLRRVAKVAHPSAGLLF